MNSCIVLQIIKNNNISFSFNTYTKISNPFLCTVQSSGTINQKYFYSKFHFIIDIANNNISDIHFYKTKILENINKIIKCPEINSIDYIHNLSDPVDSNNITKNLVEEDINKYLSHILTNGTIEESGDKIKILFENINPYDFLIEHMVWKIELNIDVNIEPIQKDSIQLIDNLQSNTNLNKENLSVKLSLSLNKKKNKRKTKSKKHKKKIKPQDRNNILKILMWAIIISWVLFIFQTELTKP
jgi:hypothetical protein